MSEFAFDDRSCLNYCSKYKIIEVLEVYGVYKERIVFEEDKAILRG